MRKISFIEAMGASFHGLVDEVKGLFGSFLSEMEIDHGSFELAVS